MTSTVTDMPGEKPAGWDRDWAFIGRELPEFVAPFFKLIRRPQRALDEKTLELVMFASDSTPSHFFEDGFLHHAREALALGATMRELLGVLAVVGTMGTQSFLLGASVLREEQAAAEHKERVAELRSRHVALLGAPIPEAEAAMHADPDGYSDWLDLANACFGPGCALEPKVAHLVAVACAALCTQLSAPAVRQHVRGALAAGASPDEILEVCQLVVGMGGHSMLKGAPLLLAAFCDDDAAVSMAPS